MRDLCRRLFLQSCLVLAGIPLPAAGAQQTILLVERPEKLVVYNQYQQSATAEEKARLRPFVPMVVVRSQEPLPDGYTSGMRVNVQGETFLLMKDPSGALAGAAGAGSVRMITGAEMIGDTVQTSGGVSAERLDGSALQVPAGTLLQRVLRADGRTYVRLLRGDGSYAWVHARPAGLFRPYRSTGRDRQSEMPAVEEAIRRKVEETNGVLRRMYVLFSRQTGRSLTPPFWTLRTLPGSLICEVSGPRRSPSLLRSTRFLAKDIENSLLGSGCRVESSAGSITVLLP